MKRTTLITTVALVLSAAATHAQDTRRNTTEPNFPPPGQATQQPTPSTAAPATPAQPPARTGQRTTPAPSSQLPPASAQSTQPSGGTAQPNSQASQPAGQAAPSTAQTPAAAPSQPAPSTAQTPAATPSQPAPATAQSPQQPNAPAASAPAQTGQAPSPAPAQQPQQNAQSPQGSPSLTVNLNDQQRTRVSTAITQLNVAPLRNANFSIAIGTTVPRNVTLHTVPTTIIDVAPQFRNHRFIVVRDEIVIVEPRTLRIVAVLPRQGARAATAPDQRRVTLTTRERAVLRKQAEEPRRPRPATTGSATETRIRVGDRLPDSIELRSFPDRMVRDVPAVRDYRYITRERRIYLVDPDERTIIEEFD